MCVYVCMCSCRPIITNTHARTQSHTHTHPHSHTHTHTHTKFNTHHLRRRAKAEVVHLTPGLLGLGVLFNCHAQEMHMINPRISAVWSMTKPIAANYCTQRVQEEHTKAEVVHLTPQQLRGGGALFSLLSLSLSLSSSLSLSLSLSLSHTHMHSITDHYTTTFDLQIALGTAK